MTALLSTAARAHLAKGELEAAASAFEQAMQGSASPEEALTACAEAARLRLALGQVKRANALVERALRGLPDTDAGRRRPFLILLSALYRWRGMPDTAQEVLSRAAPAAPANTPGPIEVDALLEQTQILLARGLLQPALALAESASAAARPLDPPAPAEAALVLAQCQLTLGLLAPAAAAASTLAKRARELGDPYTEGRALTVLGAALVEQRDYRRALPAHTNAVRLHQQSGHRPGFAASMGGLGLCHLGLGAPAQGVQCLNQAIRLCAALEAPAAEAAWRVHLDAALVRLERTELRIQELHRFIEVVRALRDEAWEAALRCELGLCYRDILDHAEAARCFDASLTLSRRRADPHTTCIDLTHLAESLLALGRPDEALTLLNEALELPQDPAHLARAKALHARATG